MTIIINKCYGGFNLPEEFLAECGVEWADDIERTDPRLVEFIESCGGEYKERCTRLVAVEVPEDCTDWELDEYDGFETITYVVGGKLYHT